MGICFREYSEMGSKLLEPHLKFNCLSFSSAFPYFLTLLIGLSVSVVLDLHLADSSHVWIQWETMH